MNCAPVNGLTFCWYVAGWGGGGIAGQDPKIKFVKCAKRATSCRLVGNIILPHFKFGLLKAENIKFRNNDPTTIVFLIETLNSFV